MAHLSVIDVSQATESDLKWIDKVAGLSYYDESLRDILRRALDGDLMLYRVGGEVGLDGVVAARVIDRRTLREFWIEFFVGKGLIAHAKAVHQALWERAKLADCKRLSGLEHNPALGKIFEGFGMKPVATVYTEEA